PVARVIALVARKPLRPLALAIVQAGATGAGAAVRFIAGPRAVALARGRVTDDLLDVFAGELIVLAGLLPGPRAELICAYADPPRQAYPAAGFAELAGRAGWAIRSEARPEGGPEGSAVAPAAPAVDDAALREVAEAARRLAEWAERCAA
ncbi:MAG TPA: hypothetical protein VK601_27505, partial [Kofleriaceae bacterium]|nr:hypothetical protein [Kofleriaceae bacterium]